MENIKYYISLLIIMVFWGLNVPLVKILVENLSPVTMTGFRVMAAGLTVFFFLSLLKLVRLPTGKEIKYIMLAAFLNVVCHHYFLSIGLKGTSGTNAGIILGSGPILTALIAALLIKALFVTRKDWAIRSIHLSQLHPVLCPGRIRHYAR